MDINHISAHPLWPFFLSVFNIWLPQIWGNSSLLHYSPQHSQGLTLSFVWNQVWTAEKDWIVPFSMPCPVYSFEYQNILTFLFYLVIFFSEVTAVRQSEKQQAAVKKGIIHEHSQKNILQGFSESFSHCNSLFTLQKTQNRRKRQRTPWNHHAP